MPYTFEICIDEAGDDGFNFANPGCSRWFVLAAAVCVKRNIPALNGVLKDLKAEIYWKNKKPLHFRDLKEHKKRIAIERLIADLRLFRAVAVMVHKPSLADPETFREKHRLYYYFTRYLLERSSWLCRDAPVARKPEYGNGAAKLVFSDRNDLSYDALAGYLAILQSKETSIEWGALDSHNITALTNGKHSGLQVADAVASAFYCGDHHCDKSKSPEWAQMLAPVMYKRRDRFRGYGVKIFPAAAENKITQGTLAPWVNCIYPL